MTQKKLMYKFKNLSLLLILAAFLAAFTDIKDLSYYQAHLNEAMALVEGRCKNYNHDDVFTKDAECLAARGAIEKDIQAKERDALLKELHKKKDKLAGEMPIKPKDKERYEISKKRFSEDVETTGDFIVECFKSDRRVQQNGVECNAAVDFMIENLEKIRKDELAKFDKEQKYKEYYQRFFREDMTRIDALLEGRCKEILANEWYPYDPQLQDKECNAAADEKNRQKRLAGFLNGDDKKNEQKDMGYYRRNPKEAVALVADCALGKVRDEESCKMAGDAVSEMDENKKKIQQYKAGYEKNTGEARKVAIACNKGDEKDDIKCQTAIEIFNEDMVKKKEQKELSRYFDQYRGNIEEAKKLLKTKCTREIKENDLFLKDYECLAIKKVVEEDVAFKDRDKLIETLANFKEKLSKKNDLDEDKDKQRYALFKQNFAEDNNTTQDFVLSCMKEKERLTLSPIECMAGADALADSLQKQRDKDLDVLAKESKHREQYQKRLRYLKEHTDEVETLINGRCKPLFDDPWYDYDEDIQDSECNAALEARRNLRRNKLLAEVEPEKVVVKDLQYFRVNMQEAESLSKQCAEGSVDDKAVCGYAQAVMDEQKQQAQRKIEYTEFYKGHFLAAKFHLRWCRAAMTSFDEECNTVADILKDHKDRPLNEKLQKKYEGYFATNPVEARVAVLGVCADKLADSWYYLDKNLQTEECNAAAEVAGE
jgi:hypothetical protein